MNTFKPNQDTNDSGTSFHGHYLSSSFDKLHKTFGDPLDISDGYKVSTHWIFESESGEVVTLYDYKETSLYDEDLPDVDTFRALPSYDWHIGAKSPEVAQRFFEFLKATV